MSKQLRCLPTDDWLEKMWYTFTMEYYSDVKKNKIVNFAEKIDRIKNNHSEWDNSDPEGQKFCFI